MDNYFVIVILVITVIVVALLFKFLDFVLNGGFPKKKSAEKKPAVKSVTAEEQIKKSVVENKPTVSMKIYNSELADDLEAMLKKSSENSQSSRLQVENHVNTENNNISKYIKEKKYSSFDFGVGDSTNQDDVEEPMTFTREDYKKFMALSNIDDDKPL